MDCTVCKGLRRVWRPPCEWEQDPGGWEPCGHCDSTGVEPPDGDAMDESEPLTRAQITSALASTNQQVEVACDAARKRRQASAG